MCRTEIARRNSLFVRDSRGGRKMRDRSEVLGMPVALVARVPPVSLAVCERPEGGGVSQPRTALDKGRSGVRLG